MSLAITPDNLVAVYAFDKWYEMKKGSFVVDAYEIVERYYEPPQIMTLGDHYPEKVKGFNGARWTTPEGDTISMALCEIKAYREAA